MISKLFDRAIRRRIYWWQRLDGCPNVGDELARVVVESMLRLQDIPPLRGGVVRVPRVFSIGSVLHFARNNDCIWGSGVNGKVTPSLHTFRALDVRAVRGPRTADFLRSRAIRVPDVFGDPGLLAPLFYPWKYVPPAAPNIICVPHMNNSAVQLQELAGKGVHICSPLQKPAAFIKALLTASKVVSMSLHGIVLAEAFGIPAVWVSGTGEADFKYLDYYEGTGRFDVRPALNLSEAIEAEGAQLPDLTTIQRSLCDTFPYDIWGG